MKPYYEDDACVIYHGDCREVLPVLGRPADLATFDPPYNVGKQYDGNDDDLPGPEYEAWLTNVLAMLVADTVTWFPGALSALRLLPLLAHSGWKFRRLLAWHKKEFAGDV